MNRLRRDIRYPSERSLVKYILMRTGNTKEVMFKCSMKERDVERSELQLTEVGQDEVE